MPVVRLPATPDGGQPPRLRPEDIAEIPPFRPSFKPEDLAEIPPFRGALDEIPPWQPPVTTCPVSSKPEGPDFIDDDASYDDAPVTNDAGTEYCVLCARAVEFSADGKHSEATAQMDAALATGLASEDPVMLTTARVEGDRLLRLDCPDGYGRYALDDHADRAFSVHVPCRDNPFLDFSA